MNNKNLSVTIGIPAYNEEANIGKLLGDILTQKSANFEIREIIISSDASIDKTVSVVKSFRDRRIVIIDNKGERQGIARGLNQIISRAGSDILVVFDADIRLVGKKFLQSLVEPILERKADLISSQISEITPRNFLARTLLVSMRLKEVLFGVFKNSDNVYTCHGAARAFSKKFYENLKFPVSIGNDMYSYLMCVKKGFKYQYVSGAVILYKLPENFSDHQKQSLRFFVTEFEMEKVFGKEFVRSQVTIPFVTYVKASFLAIPVLLKNPFESVLYFLIQLYLRFRPKPESARKQAWNMVVSSKNI